MTLQERLRNGENFYAESSLFFDGDLAGAVEEAADLLDAQEARIKRLEDALRECLASRDRDGVKANSDSPEVRGRAKSILEG